MPQTRKKFRARATKERKVGTDQIFSIISNPRLLTLIRGADLVPPGENSGNGMGISTERIPKSASRVLDAARIRAEYKQKKRARMQMGGAADANDNHDLTGGAPKPPPPHKKRRTDAGAGAGAEKCRVSTTKGKEHSSHLVASASDAQVIEIQPGESLMHFNR